jgi:FOG: GGDEF domain
MSNNDTPPAVEQLDCPQGMECPYYAELLELRNSVAQLQKDAHTDALTGLYNNRHFQISLRQEIERTQRTGQPTTLVLVDLDFLQKN